MKNLKVLFVHQIYQLTHIKEEEVFQSLLWTLMTEEITKGPIFCTQRWDKDLHQKASNKQLSKYKQYRNVVSIFILLWLFWLFFRWPHKRCSIWATPFLTTRYQRAPSLPWPCLSRIFTSTCEKASCLEHFNPQKRQLQKDLDWEQSY